MIDHLLAIKTAVDTARHSGFAALADVDLDRFQQRSKGRIPSGTGFTHSVMFVREPRSVSD